MLLAAVVLGVVRLAAASEGSGDDDDYIPSSVSGYLSRFGYLPSGSSAAGNLRTEAAVRDAIRRLQTFAGIPATGKVDADTQTLLSTKRCGLPDYPDFPEPDESDPADPDHRSHGRRRRRRWVKQGAIWDHTNLTYRIESWTADLGPQRVRRIVHESLKLWADVSALSFAETNQAHADINVKFVSRDHGDGYSFDGPNVVLAHAFFPGSGIGGDAHFDDDETWTDRPLTGYSQEVNLYSVAAHEFGHSLGLAHSDDQSSLMYPYYRHTMRKRKLPCDDTAGIQELYGTGGNPAPDKEECEDLAREFFTTTTPRPPTTPTPVPTTTRGPPTPCDTHIHALARIRNEVFVFKGRWFWRFDNKGYLVESATELRRFWYGLPAELTHVDAVYERRVHDRDEIVFFSGRQYWVFKANKVEAGYPKTLAELGLPPRIEKIDAAFVWKYNGKTYFFAGHEYWRFDEATSQVLADYPRRMSVWKGVPESPDAVFTDHEENTYFWKDDKIYKFNSFFMAVDKRFPIPISQFWTHCSGNLEIRFPDAQLTSTAPPFPATRLALLTSFCLAAIFRL